MQTPLPVSSSEVWQMMDTLFVFCDASEQTPAKLVGALQDGRWNISDPETQKETEDILKYFSANPLVPFPRANLPEFGSHGVREINNRLTIEFAYTL